MPAKAKATALIMPARLLRATRWFAAACRRLPLYFPALRSALLNAPTRLSVPVWIAVRIKIQVAVSGYVTPRVSLACRIPAPAEPIPVAGHVVATPVQTPTLV